MACVADRIDEVIGAALLIRRWRVATNLDLLIPNVNLSSIGPVQPKDPSETRDEIPTYVA